MCSNHWVLKGWLGECSYYGGHSTFKCNPLTDSDVKVRCGGGGRVRRHGYEFHSNIACKGEF